MEYLRIREDCLQLGVLWEDPDFPATQTSVFYHQTPPFQFEWKRPKEISMAPSFLEMDYDYLDISPGRMGDRWLTSCLAVLFPNKVLMYKLVPPDQDFYDNYAGVFRLQIYWRGRWTEVLVDDRLPTVNGTLTFIHCIHSSQFWPCLLEKAYAKLLGSYEALKYGSVLDGLADMTGGITESKELSGDMEMEIRWIQQMLCTASIMTCTTPNEAPTPYGMKPGMNYTIVAVEKVELTIPSEENNYIIKLSRPLSHGEKPPKAIESDIWSKFSRKLRERLTCEPNTFWILYWSMKKFATHLEVVHLEQDTSNYEPSLCYKQSWYSTIHQGQWRKGVTAGGCRNNIEFVHLNPQIKLVVEDNDTVIINLSQHSVMEPKVIGFSVYNFPTEKADTFDASFFKTHKPIVNSQYTNSRQFSQRCALTAGAHLIMPTTYEPREEAHFALRVFSARHITMKVLDKKPHMSRLVVVKAPTGYDAPSFAKYEQVFLQMADEYRTVNVFELQELLETCLPNDYVKSCATLDTCRQIVLAMDTMGKGRITWTDFKDLLFSLKHWQAVFKMYTLEKIGVLRVERLRDALDNMGIQLPEQSMALLVLRYSKKDGTLRFGDFVSAILQLKMIFKLYETKQNRSTATVELDLSNWLQCSLMC